MEKTRIVFIREELYKEVWSESMTKLAKKYSISDVGLKKICVKMNIPTPEVGYWAKIQHGKKVKKLELPSMNSDSIDRYTYYVNTISETQLSKENEIISEVHSFIEYEKLPENKIIFNETLEKPHKITKELKIISKSSYINNYNILSLNDNLSVTKDSLVRALSIFDNLIKALEKRQILFIDYSNKLPIAFIEIDGIRLKFKIKEKIKQISYIPKPTDNKRGNPFFSPPKWDFLSTGKLSLFIDEYSKGNYKYTWSDGILNIEVKLNDFIAECYKIALFKKYENEERRKRHIIWLEEQRIKEEERQALIRENKRINLLIEESNYFDKYDRVLKYIQFLESELNNVKTLDKEEIEKWLIWAKQKVEAMNPIRKFDLQNYK